MPDFSYLRQKCLERTYDQLRELDAQVDYGKESKEQPVLLDQATVLLATLERQLKAIKDQLQLADPEYASQRGLLLTHFTMDKGKKKGDWILLTSNRSASEKSITEFDRRKLSDTTRGYITDFCKNEGSNASIIAFNRMRKPLERQRGVVVPGNNKLLVPRRNMEIYWGLALGAGCVACYAFLAVGVIATSAEFAPKFLKYFFWDAIAWIFVSSSLLVLILRAFGANAKDSVSAFLAAVAIWLVVIQIGQTKINGQLEQNKKD